MMTFKVKVNTKSKKTEVIKLDKNEFIVKFNAPREKGKANEKLIEILSEYFGISKSQVKIVSGFTSSIKLVDVLLPSTRGD